MVGAWDVDCSPELRRMRSVILLHVSILCVHFGLSLICQLLVRLGLAVCGPLSSSLALKHERDLTVVLVGRYTIVGGIWVVLVGRAVGFGVGVFVDGVEATATGLDVDQHVVESARLGQVSGS